MKKNYKLATFSLCENKNEVCVKLEKYVNLILEHNKKINLTGFDEETIWKEGIYNSIISFKNFFEDLQKQIKVIDIGPGAGFPSVPLLIFLEGKFDLDLVEPNKKRALFLEVVKKELSLKMNVLNERVENIKYNYKYDLVTARAVSSLRIMIELTLNLAKQGGLYIFPKGPLIESELSEAQELIEKFNIQYNIINLKEIEDKSLNVFVYKKTFKEIKGYPRTWTEIKKNLKREN